MSDLTINVNQSYTSQSEGNSYFDGGLFQYIGWSILGGLVTFALLEFVILGQLL